MSSLKLLLILQNIKFNNTKSEISIVIFQLSQTRQDIVDLDLPPSYNEVAFVIPIGNNSGDQDTIHVNRYGESL